MGYVYLNERILTIGLYICMVSSSLEYWQNTVPDYLRILI